MKITNKQYAQALFEALEDTVATDHDVVIENFIQVLRQRGDLREYEKIITEYEFLDKQKRGVTDVEIITASDTKFEKTLLENINKVVSQNIELKHKIDENLIGGVIIKADDTLIDGSVRNQLNNLRNTLIQ